ncbi:GNAT family N-acetyltransferase [Nonomuraea sp. NN258]|uniref:GNAT family N-acetyltransferase n=1 Tax=Nonomuraea antri TaxID=2730852 RepID=UPI00156A065D|nr:GNAT family N-acetyltransferase [Nonomuraea antri]NRQ40697.1 GNAT family N-acetyltransferase [Nonomuraea antri]
MSLTDHLREWLGSWPPASNLDVTGSPRRALPGWDGRIHPAIGVSCPDGAVLSVPPEHVPAVTAAAVLAAAVTDAGTGDSTSAGTGAGTGAAAGSLRDVPALVGYGERGWFEAVYRWTTAPAPLPDAGEWVSTAAPGVPEWLYPFGGEVLVAVDPDTGTHLAGVGIKRHDRYGHELAVVTAPEARGKGLAKRLVAQAARRVLDEGAVPTYMHAHANTASAAVAKSAGFDDRGWTAFGVAER